MLNTVGVFSNSKLYEVDSTFGKRLSNREPWYLAGCSAVKNCGGVYMDLNDTKAKTELFLVGFLFNRYPLRPNYTVDGKKLQLDR